MVARHFLQSTIKFMYIGHNGRIINHRWHCSWRGFFHLTCSDYLWSACSKHKRSPYGVYVCVCACDMRACVLMILASSSMTSARTKRTPLFEASRQCFYSMRFQSKSTRLLCFCRVDWLNSCHTRLHSCGQHCILIHCNSIPNQCLHYFPHLILLRWS